MVKKSSFIFVFIFSSVLLINSFSFCSVKNELEFIIKNNPLGIPEKEKTAKYPSGVLQETSEIQLTLKLLIHTYQLFVSSQDKPSCIFSVSCSRFSQLAIQKYGVIHGLLMTSDRLQRCNSFSRKYYPIDPVSGLAKDYAIENYYLGRKKDNI